MNSTSYKNSLSKCLLAAILILSFFTFSGFIAKTQTNPTKPQTTLVDNASFQVVKSISYKRALVPIQPKYLSLFSFVSANHSYAQLVIVRITELRTTVLPRQTALFYIVKTIPQNTGDEPASLIG